MDSPFLEALFAAVCRDLAVLPGDSFIDQVRRWMEALRYTAGLKPRNRQEWLHAAEVTTKQYAAIHSLVMRRRRGLSPKQRVKCDHDFLLKARAMQDARLRYDLMRGSDAA